MSIPGSFMATPLHWQSTHFTGETTGGELFVYCPVGNIISWNPEDHKHKYCAWCKGFFGTKVNSLLNENESHLKLQ